MHHGIGRGVRDCAVVGVMEDGRNLIPQPLLEALEYWESCGLSVDWDQFIALYAEMRPLPDLPAAPT